MAIPVLASIAARFDAEFASVQFVISAYMLGLAVAQPINGYLCDRFGRRPVMLTGFTIFVLASTAAAFIDSLSGLIAMRFLQAVGVSVGTVVSRAVVRDTRDAIETTTAMSYIAAVMGFAPIIAPVLGGWVGSIGGHSSVFAVSAAMGLVVLIMMFRSLPETLDRSQGLPSLGALVHNYAVLLKSGPFLGYSMVFGFVQGSFFAFMAVGAAVFDNDLGLNNRQFGTIWGLMAVGYVLTAMASARLSRRLGSARVMGTSIAITLIAGLALFAMAQTWEPSRLIILTSMAVLMASAGGVIPGALAGVVNAHPEMAGTASGLSSALGMLLGGVFTVLAGTIYQGEFAPISWLVLASTSLTAMSWILVRKAYSNPA